MHGPDPLDPSPLPGHSRVGFLKPLLANPNILVGEYSYYDDPAGPEHFEARCVLYHYEFVGDRLIIGRYCALATGVQFIMNGANHSTQGFSTFPFSIFGKGWEGHGDDWNAGYRGDTVIGNDVWIGRQAVIMPGTRIGDGVIIGSHSVVAADVPPYGVVAGNPARLVRMRFDEAVVQRLLAIAWWNWPIDKVTRHLGAITSADLAKLEEAMRDE